MNIKKLLAAGLLVMMAQLMVAQVSNPFFDKLKGAKGAEMVEISEADMLKFRTLSEAWKHIKSMKGLYIDSTNADAVLKTARTEAEKLEKAGMTNLLSETEDAQETAIYVIKKGNTFLEIFIWGYEKEVGFYSMQLNGTFSEDEIYVLIDEFDVLFSLAK
ncbi:MAG: DUF4252 domain-containing protein [Bacteroidales bacterium]|nr:DUF4252 domain-containing protein [Bacteroidales bacterium]